MGKVVSLRDRALVEANAEMGSAGVQLLSAVIVPDSTGNRMVVGKVYEMYAPTAKAAALTTGLVWHNPDFTFTYLGVLRMGQNEYIVSDDIHYDLDSDAIGLEVGQAMTLTYVLIGGYPLCPANVPQHCIRPKTDE
jgi:hypothetical protein